MTRGWWILVGVITAIVIVCLVVILWPQSPPPSPPSPPPLDLQAEEEDEAAERLRFYEAEVEPILLAHERANRAAAERAIQRIRETFDGYRRGVDPFVEDITSWGTRLGVLVRTPGDWWYEDERINTFVSEKFEEHLFSEQQLQRDLTQVLVALREDLRANRNRLLTQVRAAVNASDLTPITLPDFTDYDRQVREDLVELAEARGQTSLYHGIAVTVGAEAVAIPAGWLAGVSVSALLSSSAAATGATATTTAGGGTAGSLAGPVGTGVGVIVGAMVGLGIDWWLTERFQERVTGELTSYLDELERGLLEGTDDDPGLKKTLERVVDDLNAAESVFMHKQLVEVG